MSKPTVGRTAFGAAVCRLIEQYQPDNTRLFNDPVAKDLVGEPVKFLMQFAKMRDFTVKQTDAVIKGLYGVQICRTRYIDDVVQAGLARGINQLVILGAGYDSRPYRLPKVERVKVFEVDLPAVQDDKKKKIRKYLGGMPKHVSFIPINFEMETLESVFPGTAFSPAKPAIFIWEGVTQYIWEESIRQTLAFVGKSAPQSVIVLTYVLKSIIEHRSDIPGAEHLMEIVAKQSPWIFGLEPPEIPDFLKPYFLSPIEDVGNADYQKRYLNPLARDLTVFEGERIVVASHAD